MKLRAYRKSGARDPRRLQVEPRDPKMSKWDPEPGTPKLGPRLLKYSSGTRAPQSGTRDLGTQYI